MNENGPDTEQGRSFDWESIRQRVTEVGRALEKSVEISPEEMRQIWARRAAELARAPVEEDESEQVKLMLIRLGREIYGFDARYVFSVRPAELITCVPRVPDWVTGVVNLRGRIFSVVDLRRFFDLPPAEANDDETEPGGSVSHLVVVETPDMEIALLADEVLTVESLPTSQMQDVTGTVRGLRPEYVQGVIARQGEDTDAGESSSMVVVLDLLALLADERLIVHEEIV